MGMIRENPLLGIGFGNVLERFGEFGKLFSFAMGRPLEIHNAFLEVFAEGGVGAFLIFAAMLFIPFGILFKRAGFPALEGYPLLSIAGLNIIFGIIIYCFFYPEFLGHDDFWAYFVLVFLILRSKEEIPAELIRAAPGIAPGKPGPAGGALSSP
jgi:O-antigen ligase